ncbi:hypothetical protein SEVIR_3G378302v4 [Setaria viridis]
MGFSRPFRSVFIATSRIGLLCGAPDAFGSAGAAGARGSWRDPQGGARGICGEDRSIEVVAGCAAISISPSAAPSYPSAHLQSPSDSRTCQQGPSALSWSLVNHALGLHLLPPTPFQSLEVLRQGDLHRNSSVRSGSPSSGGSSGRLQ